MNNYILKKKPTITNITSNNIESLSRNSSNLSDFYVYEEEIENNK